MFRKGGRQEATDNVTEEVQILKNRVELLEQVRHVAIMFQPKVTHHRDLEASEM